MRPIEAHCGWICFQFQAHKHDSCARLEDISANRMWQRMFNPCYCFCGFDEPRQILTKISACLSLLFLKFFSLCRPFGWSPSTALYDITDAWSVRPWVVGRLLGCGTHFSGGGGSACALHASTPYGPTLSSIFTTDQFRPYNPVVMADRLWKTQVQDKHMSHL